jgi:hypothetical protein
MKLKNSKLRDLVYALPFFFFLNPASAKAQFKLESNLNDLDLKSKYFDLAVSDTFGLKELTNIRGMAKLKYDNSSVYFIRNGLLNYYYGGDLDLKFVSGYHNESRQNVKTQTESSQESPLGTIVTHTDILNEGRSNESGVKLKYGDFFVSAEKAYENDKIDGTTLVDVGGNESLSSFTLNLENRTTIYGAGFKYGYVKFIQNEQNGNKSNNCLVKADYDGFNIYYGKNFSGFLSFNLFDKVDVDVSYDRELRVAFATSDYSKLNREDFEMNLENKLRAVPRIYDSNLETSRSYIKDMFFTKDYNFSLSQDNVDFNINFNNILFHYSKGSEKIGFKYKFGIVTYDFQTKEARIGVFFE